MTENATNPAAKPKAPAKAKAEKSAEPKRYTSTADVMLDRYYKAGEPFVTDAPKGENWTEVSQADFAAIQASTDTVPDDANLEEAHEHALQAVAIMKHVTITGLDKAGLITAIKAAYEPKL